MLPEVGKPGGPRENLPSERGSIVRKKPSVYQAVSYYVESQDISVPEPEPAKPAVKTNLKKETKGLLDSIYQASLQKVGSAEGHQLDDVPAPARPSTFQPKKYTQTSQKGPGQSEEVAAPVLNINMRSSVSRRPPQLVPDFKYQPSRASQSMDLPPVPQVEMRASLSGHGGSMSGGSFMDSQRSNQIPDAPVLAFDANSGSRRTIQQGTDLESSQVPSGINFKKNKNPADLQFVHIDSKKGDFATDMGVPNLKMEKIVSSHNKRQVSDNSSTMPVPSINMSNVLRGSQIQEVARLSGTRLSIRQPDMMAAPQINARQSLFKAEMSGDNLPALNLNRRTTKADDLIAPELKLTASAKSTDQSVPSFYYVPRQSQMGLLSGQVMPNLGNSRASLANTVSSQLDAPILAQPVRNSVMVMDDIPKIDLDFINKARDEAGQEAPSLPNYRPSIAGYIEMEAPRVKVNVKSSDTR